jgi:predicted CopG family antitoxin
MSNEHRRYTISLSGKVYTRLRNCGKFGESFNDLISRLLDLTENFRDFAEVNRK